MSTSDKTPTAASHLSSLFRMFRADFNYFTSDLEGIVVRLTARAFTHLQRSIVADQSIRRKWIAAYIKGETSCEKLGAVHLLLHGIWGFKVNSAGERTDLILNEPFADSSLEEVHRTAEGLVLTEWKLATELTKAKKCDEAYRQAEIYTKGSLATIELKGYRYLVIVSEDFLDLPNVFERDGIEYRYINIAVKPSTPSVRARRPTKAMQKKA